MLDRFVHPLRAIEDKEVASQVARRSQRLRIGRLEFVSGQHQPNHLIVGEIFVQGFDDPVAPVPHMTLAVSELRVEPPPIAVAPVVHPMASPAFSMAWIVE